MLGGPVSHCFGEECLMLTRKLTKTSVYFDRPDTSLNRTMSPSFVWVVFIFLHYKTWTDRTTSLNWDIFYSVPWVSRLAFSFTVLSIRSDLPVYVSLKKDSHNTRAVSGISGSRLPNNRLGYPNPNYGLGTRKDALWEELKDVQRTSDRASGIGFGCSGSKISDPTEPYFTPLNRLLP